MLMTARISWPTVQDAADIGTNRHVQVVKTGKARRRRATWASKIESVVKFLLVAIRYLVGVWVVDMIPGLSTLASSQERSQWVVV